MTWYALRVFFTDKSELNYLPFHSRQPHFNKAQIEWRGLVLNPVTGRDQPIVDLGSEDPSELLKNLYSDLSFIELCELKQATADTVLESLNWSHFFSLQNMHYNERVEQLMACLAKTLRPFRDWCHQRKMAPQELMPLLGLPTLTDFNTVSDSFVKLNVSRNEGKQALDLIVDLLLLDHKPDSLIEADTSRQWLQKLTQLRNPMTLERDRQAVLGSSLPKYARMDRQRQGDHIVNKIHVEFTDTNDLRKKLQRLSQSQEF